jgi:hypothetical protein
VLIDHALRQLLDDLEKLKDQPIIGWGQRQEGADMSLWYDDYVDWPEGTRVVIRKH